MAQLSTVSSEKEELQSNVDSLNAKRDGAEALLRASSSAREELAAGLASTRSSLAEARTSAKALAAERDVADARAVELASGRSAAARSLTALQHDKDELALTLKSARAELSRLEQEKKADASERGGEAARLLTEAERARSEIFDLNSRVDEATCRAVVLESECGECREQLEGIMGERDQV